MSDDNHRSIDIVRNLFPVLIAAATTLAAPGHATVTLTSGVATIAAADIGSAFTINYDGRSGEPVAVISGLKATSTFSLASVTNAGKTWTFAYSVDNVSVAPVNGSRVSVFGFDVNRALAGGSSATGVFGASTGSGNVPNGLPDVDICFRAGGGGGNCAGGGGAGVTASGPVATGTFSLKFAAAQSSIALSNFYARYQSLDVTGNPATSASGVGTVQVPVVAAVPEPATWGMMAMGFGLVGAGARRRRATTVTA